MKLNNKSPLRYPGGKTRACKLLEQILIENYNIKDYNLLVSPFFGGGSFEFYIQNKYNFNLIVNDKFTPLYNFWNQIKLNKELLCKELRKITSVSKDLFLDYRNTILNLDHNILQQAIQYFIINRCSFSGSTLSGGFSKESSLKRYTASSINRIESLNLINLTLYNLDFVDFINHFDNHKTSNDKEFLFLDPPYYLEKKSKLYGHNGDLHNNFNHELLFNTIKSKKNWLLTYNNCTYIKNLYKDYIILEVNWSYGMNSNKQSSEIVILSKLKIN